VIDVSERLVAACRLVHGETPVVEPIGHQVADQGLVLDDQNGQRCFGSPHGTRLAVASA
jgi:hypothetical protein